MRLLFLVLLPWLFSGCQKHSNGFVIGKIKSTCALATTKTTIRKAVIGYKNTRTFFNLVGVGEASYLAETEATIETGIRLEKIKPENIKIEGTQIIMKLPGVEVLNFDYPFDKVEVNEMATRNSLFVKTDIYDEESYFRQAERDIREQLPYIGLVEETKRNVTNLLSALLTQLGFEDIYIEFENAELLQSINIPDQPKQK